MAGDAPDLNGEEARGFIASVLESISDVLIVCNSEGRVEQANRAASKLTGFSEDELVGRSVKGILAPGYCCGRSPVCPCPETSGVRDREVRFLTSGGAESEPVSVTCAPRRDLAGGQVGVVLIGRPVGELRRAYEALGEADRSLQDVQRQLVQSAKMASIGRLVAGVAHELNNPTSFVYGNVHSLEKYADRLQRYVSASRAGTDGAALGVLAEELEIARILDDLPSLIAGTKEGAERIRDIIKSLKRLSLSDARAEHEPFALADAVVNAVAWSVKGRQARVDVDLDVPAGLRVRGSVGQVQQVVVNLVDNALDAMEGVGTPRLEISCAAGDGMVSLEVRDTGRGIGAEDLGKVFDPFFTTKPVGSGMGLGLWICYDIVKGHGGGIEVANHPDGGAVFTVMLPSVP